MASEDDSLFVRKQLKFCECLNYADLFKDYTEEQFRNLTCSALNKLPLDDDAKDKISDRLCELKLEARTKSQQQLSSSLTLPIKTEHQVKQEVNVKNEEPYAAGENDDDIEFLCVVETQAQDQQQNNSQGQVLEEGTQINNNIPGTSSGPEEVPVVSSTSPASSVSNKTGHEVGSTSNIDGTGGDEESSGLTGQSPNNDQAKNTDLNLGPSRKRNVPQGQGDIEFLCVGETQQDQQNDSQVQEEGTNQINNNIPNTSSGTATSPVSVSTTEAGQENRMQTDNESICSGLTEQFPNNDQAKNTDLNLGSSRRKRKVPQRLTNHDDDNDASSSKTSRFQHNEPFWTEFASYISKISCQAKQAWIKNLLPDETWNPDSSGRTREISIRTFACMTKAIISSSSLKKNIKVKTLLEELKLPENLKTLAEDTGLLKITRNNNYSSVIKLSEILNFIFKVATNLQELIISIDNLEDLNLILENLVGIPKQNLVKLELKSNSIAITQIQLLKLADLAPTYFNGLESLSFDCNVQIDDNNDPSLNLILYRLSNSLKEFKVTKNLVGFGSKICPFEIIVPEGMKSLEKIDISSKYDIFTTTEEIMEPEVVNVEEEQATTNFQEKLIDIPVLVNFTGQKYEKLVSIRLGSKIEVNLTFENFPALEIFVVGSPWNLRNIFGNENKQYKLKYIQFPDALTDPSIFQQVKTFCPELTRVKLQLPTVACLQEFLNVFANTKIERLLLTFDYVFEAALICPLAGIPFKLSCETDLAKMTKLKEYSDWPTFVKRKRIDIPQEAEHSAIVGQKKLGLSNLTGLKFLKIGYHSRKLKYPKENGNGDFLLEKHEFLSFDMFPLGKEFWDELIKLCGSGSGFRRLRKVNILTDPIAQQEFNQKTGRTTSGIETKSRPNGISSAALISRKTEVKHEKDDE